MDGREVETTSGVVPFDRLVVALDLDVVPELVSRPSAEAFEAKRRFEAERVARWLGERE